jgi:Calcineurin-like phosphoesterase
MTPGSNRGVLGKPLIDPRRGDVETDVSSTKQHSMLSLAGGLLVEISLPKLLMAWTLLLVVPGLLVGLAPLAISDWVRTLYGTIATLTLGLWSLLVLTFLLALAWFGWRTLFRLIENSFWALNSVVVQPVYATTREGLRQIAENLFAKGGSKDQYATLRAASAVAAGLLICTVALLILYLIYPSAELFGSLGEIGGWRDLVGVAFANSAVMVLGYLAIGALIWGVADATTPQPRDLTTFDERPAGAKTWRVVHLSDVHVVGEHYGFRIESGRSGPRGNERLKRVLNELEAIHAKEPLDLVLITGDMTDAGTPPEWAEFLDALAAHPRLAERALILPGNHDLNIVDRANPARLDLPTSPNRRLRQLRTLSAMDDLQGDRVHVVELGRRRIGKTLAEFLEPHSKKMARFADVAKPLLSYALPELWAKVFPLVLPPVITEDGLGVILLNSNADTHFSFTNALGLVSAEQVRGIEIAIKQYPRACWIIALHHHAVEYPRPAKALSERIGTALINGNWFVRKMQPLAGKVILMHGHRHIDWIGHCAGLVVVSAPSPVMEVTDEKPTGFYIHTLAIGADGRLRLLSPERITVPGETPQDAAATPTRVSDPEHRQRSGRGKR